MIANAYAILREVKSELRTMQNFAVAQPTLEKANARLELLSVQCREIVSAMEDAEAEIAKAAAFTLAPPLS